MNEELENDVRTTFGTMMAIEPEEVPGGLMSTWRRVQKMNDLISAPRLTPQQLVFVAAIWDQQQKKASFGPKTPPGEKT